MSIADELKKLQDLRESGVLSEEEFVRAKDAVLQGRKAHVHTSRPQHTDDGGFLQHLFAPKRDSLGDAAHRYVSFQIVMGVIGVVVFLIFLFAVFLPAMNSGPRFP